MRIDASVTSTTSCAIVVHENMPRSVTLLVKQWGGGSQHAAASYYLSRRFRKITACIDDVVLVLFSLSPATETVSMKCYA